MGGERDLCPDAAVSRGRKGSFAPGPPRRVDTVPPPSEEMGRRRRQRPKTVVSDTRRATPVQTEVNIHTEALAAEPRPRLACGQ